MSSLAALLDSPVGDVQLAALDAIASLCYQNQRVSALLTVSNFGGKSVTDHLVILMARDRPVAMQLAAARCLTYLHRAGAISADDGKILYKTLPCLVRMCRKESRRAEKALGAETLAYLIEVDTELQRVASISDHLIHNLSLFFLLPAGAVAAASSATSHLGQQAQAQQQQQTHSHSSIKINFSVNINNNNKEFLHHQQQHHHQLQHSNETESLGQDSFEPSLREVQNLKQAALLVNYITRF